MYISLKIIFIISFFSAVFVSNAQPGSNDPSFISDDLGLGSNQGANGTIWTTAIQVDGKIVVAGEFTSFNNTACNRIVRLNINGTLDPTFVTGSAANNIIYATALQNDGKIIIGGTFTAYNGISCNRIARLNTDGSLDGSFDIGTGTGTITALAIQNDGKIIICGLFGNYNNIPIRGVARLNTDGSLDPSFNPGSGTVSGISDIAIQSDGKIVLVGSFTSFNDVSFGRIVRLNSNGTIDETFNPGSGALNLITSVEIQSDGKILIGGSFQFFNNVVRNRIARLNSDGSLDPTFTTSGGVGANSRVNALIIQPDSKIVVGGDFTSYNGITRNRLVRINNDASLDEGFDSGVGGNNSIRHLSLQSDGNIIAGGDFTSYNGVIRNRLTRVIGSVVTNSYIRQPDDMPEIKIYPNPATKYVIVNYSATLRRTNQIQVINSSGNIIKMKYTKDPITFIEVSDLHPGFYLLKITEGKKARVYKVQIQ